MSNGPPFEISSSWRICAAVIGLPSPRISITGIESSGFFAFGCAKLASATTSFAKNSKKNFLINF